MLAPNYLPAEALGISGAQLEALVKTLGFFERGDVRPEQFSMRGWCGSVCCIGGWAERISGKRIFYGGVDDLFTAGLSKLFYPPDENSYYSATIEQAARALRNYLVTGSARWSEVMADQ